MLLETRVLYYFKRGPVHKQNNDDYSTLTVGETKKTNEMIYITATNNK